MQSIRFGTWNRKRNRRHESAYHLVEIWLLCPSVCTVRPRLYDDGLSVRNIAQPEDDQAHSCIVCVASQSERCDSFICRSEEEIARTIRVRIVERESNDHETTNRVVGVGPFCPSVCAVRHHVRAVGTIDWSVVRSNRHQALYPAVHSAFLFQHHILFLEKSQEKISCATRR